MSQTVSKAEIKAGKKKNELLETIIVIVEALIIALIFRSFLYQPFSIPTASMQQTLMIGDYFLANKWAWGFGKYSFPIAVPFNGRIMGSEPKRGDVAVFRNEITNEDYIKRVIGLPGDTIQMREGRLYINGTMVEREKTGMAKDTDSYLTTVDVTVYTETLPNGVKHTIQEISDDESLDNTPEYGISARGRRASSAPAGCRSRSAARPRRPARGRRSDRDRGPYGPAQSAADAPSTDAFAGLPVSWKTS